MAEDRKNLTFEQAEGTEPLPRPLALREVSNELRAYVWAIFHGSLEKSQINVIGYHSRIKDPWETILKRYHVYRRHLPIDEFSNLWFDHEKDIKNIIYKGTYDGIIGFIEWVLREEKAPFDLFGAIQTAFKEARAAYKLVDKDCPTFYPAANEEQGQAITKAVELVKAKEFFGAKEHLRKAATELNSGKYGDSVRESIHAVESVACQIDDRSKSTLKPALKKLHDQGAIHPALKGAFEKLYGYTSDEQGIRHSMHDNSEAVGMDEAVFMLGACASFTTYLINSAEKKNLLKGKR